MDARRGVCSNTASESQTGWGDFASPRFAWIGIWGACCALSPLLLRSYLSHFDVDLLLLPLMLITRGERSKEAREEGRRGGGQPGLAWQTVSFNDHFYR